MNPSTLSILLGYDLKAFEKNLEDNNDEIVQTNLNFVKLVRDVNKFMYSCKIGDPIIIEVLLIRWIPIFYSVKKTRYVAMGLRNTKQLLHYFSDPELEELRTNRFIKLCQNKGCLAWMNFVSC